MENENKERGMELEAGLPNLEDLIPLSHCLISPELMSAFNIVPDPCKTIEDVDQASRYTLAMLKPHPHRLSSYNSFDLNFIPVDDEDEEVENCLDVEDVEGCDKNLTRQDDSKSKNLPKINVCAKESDLSLHMDNDIDNIEKMPKRLRIAWTPNLHKRFIDVVAYLGIQNAVPNTIIQMMNVEGLTRDNVASHLQKYRLYLNRKQEVSEPTHLASTSIRSKNGQI